MEAGQDKKNTVMASGKGWSLTEGGERLGAVVRRHPRHRGAINKGRRPPAPCISPKSVILRSG